MTWNDLIARLNEIPLEQREENAMFYEEFAEEDGEPISGEEVERQGFEIDDLDKTDDGSYILTP